MAGTTTNKQEDANISLSVAGRDCPFKFQKRTGGKIGSNSSKTIPGGQEPAVSHGGSQELEDLTLEAEMIPSRDDAYIQFLKPIVGKARAAAAEHLLDTNGQVLETLNRWGGTLTELDTGNYDATSSDPRMISLTVETDGVPG